jgi:hypothetical protein
MTQSVRGPEQPRGQQRLPLHPIVADGAASVSSIWACDRQKTLAIRFKAEHAASRFYRGSCRQLSVDKRAEWLGLAVTLGRAVDPL